MPVSKWARFGIGFIALCIVLPFILNIGHRRTYIPPAAVDYPDSDGLIAPEGHVHAGTWVYLRGERVARITGFFQRRSELYADHRLMDMVSLDFQGKPDETSLNNLIRLYRVRPDEQ